MTEQQRINTCLNCPLAHCVEDLPLFRHQCPIVQADAAAVRVRQARHQHSVARKNTTRRHAQSFKAKVAQMLYRMRTDGAAQKRYEQTTKARLRRKNKGFDPATLRLRYGQKMQEPDV